MDLCCQSYCDSSEAVMYDVSNACTQRKKKHRVTVRTTRGIPSHPIHILKTSCDYCPNCIDTPCNRSVIVNGMQYNEFNNDEFKKV